MGVREDGRKGVREEGRKGVREDGRSEKEAVKREWEGAWQCG